MEKLSPVQWLIEQLRSKQYGFVGYEKIIEQAELKENEKEYELKAYWFGRGILAGKEDRIEELSPKKQ